MARKDKTHEAWSDQNAGDNGGSIDALVSAMEQEAAQEADKILTNARKEADRKLLYAEKQVESILGEARQNAGP